MIGRPAGVHGPAPSAESPRKPDPRPGRSRARLSRFLPALALLLGALSLFAPAPAEAQGDPPPQPPDPPTVLEVSANDGQLIMTWTAPTTGGAVAGYDFHYTSASGDDVDDDADASGADPSTAWVAAPRGDGTFAGQVILGLTNGTEYRLRVRAKNDGGASAWLRGTGTPAVQIPAMPENLRVTVGDGRLDLAWRKPSAVTVTGYDVHYTSASGDDVDDDADASGADPSTAWVDAGHTGTAASHALTGLDNGTVYRVRVRAVNGAGNGPWARRTGTPLSADMLPAPRPVPTGGVALWSAVLTVQDVSTSNGQVVLRGCGDGTGKACTTNLTDNTFRFDGAEHRITHFTLFAGNYLSFKLNRNLAGEKRRLVLVVDGTRFWGRDGTFDQGGNVKLGWTDSGLTWSAGDTVSLSLVEIPTVRLEVSPNPVPEGTAVSIEASLWRGTGSSAVSHVPAGSVEIPLIVRRGTAEESDYGEGHPRGDGTRRPVIHIHGAHQLSFGTVNIPTHRDHDADDETFTVMLDTNNLPSQMVEGGTTSVEVTVEDLDEPADSRPAARLSVWPNPVPEGSLVAVSLILSSGLKSDVTVPLLVTPESSEVGDHGTLAGITITARHCCQTAVITTKVDADGDDETFTVALDTNDMPKEVKLGSPASVTVTIEDDGVVRQSADGASAWDVVGATGPAVPEAPEQPEASGATDHEPAQDDPPQQPAHDPPPALHATLIGQMNDWRSDPQWVSYKEHTDRWDRALLAFGEPVSDTSLTPMTADEAQGYADRGWTRWAGVAEALNTVVTGTSGADTLSGTDSGELLVGLGGADSLSGHGGNDELRGGSGNDRLTGGAGSDRFVFFDVDTGDKTLTDFASDDVIVLKGTGWPSAADIIASVEGVGSVGYRYTLASGLTVETTNNRPLRTEDFVAE